MARKRLPSNTVIIIVVLALFVVNGVLLPGSTGQTLIGGIILEIALAAAAVALYRAGKKKDARRLVGAEIFEDAKKRAKNRAAGVTTFSLAYHDGSHDVVTVKDDSEEYREYIALGREKN